jgi:hypothetical protein
VLSVLTTKYSDAELREFIIQILSKILDTLVRWKFSRNKIKI